MFFGSSGSGFLSILGGDSAPKLDAQKKHAMRNGVDLIIGEETVGHTPCPIGSILRSTRGGSSTLLGVP